MAPNTGQANGNGNIHEVKIIVPHLELDGEHRPPQLLSLAVTGAAETLSLLADTVMIFIGPADNIREDGSTVTEPVTVVAALTSERLGHDELMLLRQFGVLTRTLLGFERLAIEVDNLPLMF